VAETDDAAAFTEELTEEESVWSLFAKTGGQPVQIKATKPAAARNSAVKNIVRPVPRLPMANNQ
jgi:hypothetical protein